MDIRSIISRFISYLKKEEWRLSENISLTYLFFFLLEKLFSLIRGFFFFPFSFKLIFIGDRTVINSRNNFRFGKNLQIGKGCHIDALSSKGVSLGNNVSIGKFTTIECSGSLKNIGVGLSVGDYSSLGTHGYFGCAGGIKIGSNTIFGNFVSMHSENHNFKSDVIPIRLQGVNSLGIKIGDNCWIGAKVTILDGVEIPNGCILAAGALVIPGVYKENSIYGGVPAKLLKSRFDE